MAMIALASVAGQWNGALPSNLTLLHFRDALRGQSATELKISLLTGFLSSLIALACGSWAALAMRSLPPSMRRLLGAVFFLPSAVPTVSVGLGLLVASSQRPLLLNGTMAIVILAHFIVISSFAFGNVSAGLAALSRDYEEIGASLGARRLYLLWRVTLPLIAPYLVSAFSLSFAFSMGELGATLMVYPPGWMTLPVDIFALTDRGDIFAASALTILLIGTTLAVLFALSVMSGKAARH